MAIASGLAGAGASIFGAFNSQSAADDASKQQYKMYNQMRSDMMPYMQGGAGAFGQLGNLLGMGPNGTSGALSTMQNMPGYQFALQQGQQGVDRGMAARGLGISGGEMKDIDSYSQGLASQNYNSLVGQLSGMAGMGMGAASGLGTAGMGAASNSGSAQLWGANQFNQGLMGGMNSMFGQNGAFSGMNWGQFSDRRLKTGVRRVGETDSGVPLYLYRFKGSALPQIGVMADEVEKVDPAAVATHPSGFKMVDYDRVARLPARRPVSQLPAIERMAA